MDPLSVTASTLAIIGAISSTYKTIEHLRGLPKEFSQVDRALPVTRNTLVKACEQIQAEDLDETTRAAIGAILAECQEKAQQLKDIFDHVQGAARDGSSVLDLYRTSLLRLGKSHRVETLMRDIMRGLETLETNWIFRTASQRQVDELKEAVETLSMVESSVTDSELIRDTSAVFNQTVAAGGTGLQQHFDGQDHKVNSGSGTLHNYNAGVNVYYGTAPQAPYIVENMVRSEQARLIDPARLLGQRNYHAGQINLDVDTPSIGYPIEFIPFQPVTAFTGRESTLASLKKTLFEHGKDRVALVGLGGMGKTQVALHLAWWVFKNKSYTVLWLPGHSKTAFEKACNDVVRDIGMSHRAGEDPKEQIRQYLRSQKSRKWFIVVDNADEMPILCGDAEDDKGILGFLPRSEHGSILFTTRSQEVATTVAGTDIEDLAAMSQEEGRLLLERSLKRHDQIHDTEAVEALLEKLVYLPLAIAQAAAYLNMNDYSIRDYIPIFEATPQDAVGLLSKHVYDDAHHKRSQGSAVTTWFISFDQIQRTDTVAARLLWFIRWIEPKGIPSSILPKQLGSEQQYAQAIGTLCGYRFLYKRSEKNETFDMHSLVHLALTVWAQRQDTEDQSRQAAFEHLNTIFNINTMWNKREIKQILLPHVLRILALSKHVESESYCRLGYAAGRCLAEDGRLQEAITQLEHLVLIAAKVFTRHHQGLLQCQNGLAIAYMKCGNLKGALSLLENVARIRDSTLAEDDPSRLVTNWMLALAYMANKQHKKAIELLEHVAAVRERVLPKDHLDRLDSVYALGLAHLHNGKASRAVKLLEYVMSVHEATLAQHHPRRLASQDALGLAYLRTGNSERAVELLESVVSSYEAMLAEYHPDLLEARYHLAEASLSLERFADGVSILESVVGIYRKTVPDDHPGRLTAEEILARGYKYLA